MAALIIPHEQFVVPDKRLCKPRFITPRNPERRTVGHEVAATSRKLGFEPMPWQCEMWDTQYELNEDGSLYYREARITVPRQSAKTVSTLVRTVHRQTRSKALGWLRDGEKPVSVYSAQTATAARAKMVEDWMPVLRDSVFDPFDEDGEEVGTSEEVYVKKYRLASGGEAIAWSGGGAMRTVPPNQTAGHGRTVDQVDLDEIFAYADARAEQALRPAMITRLSPQLTVQSTAGTVDSTYLWGKVDDGRARVEAGSDDPVFYIEYSAGPADDIHDPDHWPRWMPALRTEENPGGTISLEAVKIEHDTLPEDEWARAYCNVWTGSTKRVISLAAWNRAADEHSEIVKGNPIWMAADASPGGDGVARRGSIAVAGRRADGSIHVEVLMNEEGINWMPEAIAKLTRLWPVMMLYIDKTGPIGSVVPQIQDTANATIEIVDANTMASSCTAFHEGITGTATSSVRHLHQPWLDAAVDGAAQRTLQDSWAWSRRKASTDISPLVAVTLSHWGCVTEAQGSYDIF